MSAISVFGGTGFIGSEFCNTTNRKTCLIERESRTPRSSECIYFISTTNNYNVFEDVHKDIDINLSLLVDVLKNLTPGNSIFNFISSWFVYGECNLPASEESPCQPKGFYSITKRAAEQLIISYCQTFNIKYRILRLCNVYGKNDKDASKKKNAFQFLIEKLKKNEEIELYYNGDFYRDYMHVTDVAQAIDLCIDKAPINEIINIGSGNKVNFKELIDKAVAITGSKSKITNVEPADFHKVVQIKDFYMNITKLEKLRFTPTISLDEGIKELCQ